MKTQNIFLFIAIISGLFSSCKEDYPDLEDGLYAEINTSMGPMIAELYFEETPLTVGNFVSLAEGNNKMADSSYGGKPYYNGLIFHRIIDGFMIQGGDPTGTGSGGPGYKFPDEFQDSLSHDSKGILSMANAGPGTNGSQFFITLAPVKQLDNKHTVFGKLVKGMDVLEAIGKVETGPRDKPTKDVTINEINIIRKGKAAKNFDAPAKMESSLKKIEDDQKAEQEKIAAMASGTKTKFEEIKLKADSLDSGLKIYYEQKGEGEQPKIGQQVLINYAGYFEDGTLFDSNMIDVAKENNMYDHRREQGMGYQPISVAYGPDAPMIQGFRDAIQQMKVGDKVVVFIPSELAYGTNGYGSIPPNTNLIFRMELVDIAE
ncbi:peptidylprolyl isomerase [Gramella sp. AN32]|uniref:peptidylprolyl isomerase n=1 Tax=Christiangramia antarctica TaxID=2058158 RepID=A0ABW5X7R6_9FLAO|nr:peptidylprolyl isomerase [Gramella sp. AN32]MCM4154453.1 peptidylprolyl isomerase [Gramella sp. AN32]